ARRSHHRHRGGRGARRARRRRGHGRTAPHLVEFRFLAQGADRASQGGLEAAPLRHRPGRRGRGHPAAGVTAYRYRPMTDHRADIPSVAERTRPVHADAPVVGVHFLGTTAAFVLGEEALVLLAPGGEVERVTVHGGGILSSAADGTRLLT